MTSTSSTPPLNGELLIPLSQAAKRYPGHRGATRLHPATLTRWILKGVKGLNGTRVKLEALRVGCRWLTSEAALQRFTESLSEGEGSAPLRSPSARQVMSERAAAELEAMGA
ncbi:DUF1580 domain-containing protein [Gemmata sp. G18]|uniref:DUF1580 domain-containing protein n=1 Tax=Gemmata palustris TaxID=2822762 RepID=A0ABS5C0K9_9BACT|nr:DUF1580 domain-containing protein [Gemmata palustris]